MPKRGVSWWRSERDIRTEVDEELAFHLQLRARELERAGLNAAEARAEAQREFGDIEDARSYMVAVDRRQERWSRMRHIVDSIVQDIRIGARGLIRDRGFTAVAVLTLALGIGANSAIYTLVDGVLLRPLPYGRPAELVAVSPEHSFMRAEFDMARERLQSVSALGGFQAGVGVSVSGDAEAVRLVAALVSADLFRTLEVEPAGRGFERAHELVGAPAVAVISHRLWHQRFGGASSALGSTLVIDGVTREIIGIMPERFAFPDAHTDIWLPATIDAAQLSTYWGIGGLHAIGRLRPGAGVEQVQAELRALGDPMRFANPFWTPKEGYRSDGTVLPLRTALVSDARVMLLMLMGAVLLVWLIACANVGNLMLSRGLAREGELAVRMALGAGRRRVIRQLLTESTLLALLGGLAGFAVGWALLRVLLPYIPADLPRIGEVRLDMRVLGFTMLASLLAAAVFGVFPAMRVADTDAQSALREGARAGTSGRRRRLSSGLVVAEVALAVVLVAGAGLLLRSLENLGRVDTGFSTERVITARLSPPPASYREPARRVAFYDHVMTRVAGSARVQAVAVTKQLPFDGELSLSAAAVEHVATDPNELPVFELRAVTPDYFRALTIPLLEGRTFEPADGPDALPVAIVDRAAAAKFWPGESAVGKRIGRPWMQEWRTIVGVVGAVRNNELTAEPEPAIYIPFAQEPSTASVLVVRSSADMRDIGTLIRTAVAEADPNVPVSHLSQYRELVSSAAARERTAALLVGMFAALALLLGAVGLYGVLSYAVTQRAHELSVRTALGATRGSLMQLVLREGLMLGAIGVAFGVPAAVLAAGALRSILYGVEAADPLNLLLVITVLLAACTAAALIPALRAVRAEPASALRA